VRGFGSLYLRGQSLGVDFLGGLSFLVVECGYPLFRYPTGLDLNMAREGPRCSVRPSFGRSCAPSHAIPDSGGSERLSIPSWASLRTPDRKVDKPHYVILADDLTHGSNERINFSE
jgi:hypothetical protein